MKILYPQISSLISDNRAVVIVDPRVMGIIKECGGKLALFEKKWDQALDHLFESFKFYQEIGNLKAKNILVYVILASMLSHS